MTKPKEAPSTAVKGLYVHAVSLVIYIIYIL